jgi:toxin-antitoxin system PIN domain toxin
VILVDVNLLLYATVREFPQHSAAHEWLDDRLAGTSQVGLPWSSLLGFLRIATSARVFKRPLGMHKAWERVELWLSAEAAWIPHPADRHADILAGLLAAPGIRGDLVPDAHLAALAMEHGLTLCSTDGDFARFEGLRWQNPLSGG